MLSFKLFKKMALTLSSFVLSASMIYSSQSLAIQTLHSDIRFENKKFITQNNNVKFDNEKFTAQVDLPSGGEYKAKWAGEKVGAETIGRFTETLEESAQDYTMSTASFDSNGYPRSKTKCFGSGSTAYCATATERLCQRVREARLNDDKLEKAVAKNKECAASLSYSKSIIDAMMKESPNYNNLRMQTVQQDMDSLEQAMAKRKFKKTFSSSTNISNITTDSEAESMAQSFDQSFQGLRAISAIVEMCSQAGEFVTASTSKSQPTKQNSKTGTN